MDLLVGVEVIHTSKASQTQVLNHSRGYKLHWMQMCSVCRTSAAAALSRRALPTKRQPGLLVRLLLWEFGDLGSTLCEAQPPQEPQGTQSVRAGVAAGDTESLAGRDLLARTQGRAGCCPCPPLSHLLPGSGTNTARTRERQGQCARAGVDRMRILLSSGRAQSCGAHR